MFCTMCSLLAGCASTNLTYVYKPAEYNPAVYKRLAVLAIVPKDQVRIAIEDAMVSQLRSKGINAVSTWSDFVFANQTELIKKAGFEGEKRKEIIKQKVTQHNIDALLIITLFDSKREQRYVQGSGPTVGVGVGVPVYGYPYSAYFGYAWDVTSTPGYYEDTSTFMFESNLYDIASEKLLWSGQTKTDMNYSLEQEINGFCKIVTSRLVADGQPAKK
jgi:hypothetical protein